MRKEFSTAWTASKQPRKQRKYAANAPIHIKRKQLSVNLSKDLRTKTGKRNAIIKKGDKVKVMRGKFKGVVGKILEVKIKALKIIMENVQLTKKDGSKVNVKMRPSNLQIIELEQRNKAPSTTKESSAVEKKTDNKNETSKEKIIEEKKTEEVKNVKSTKKVEEKK